MTVEAGGNVAIGTGVASPQERLTLSQGSTLATEMEVPTGVVAAPASGGNLPGGAYFFRIVAEDGSGETTIGSLEVSCTVDGTSEKSCLLSWTPVQGATQYRVYIGSAAGGQDRYHLSTATQYLYDGEASQDGTGPVPAVTSAYVNKLSASGSSWMLGGNVGVGTTQPGATLQVNGDLLLQRGVPISEISDDSTMAGNLADAVPTQQAVKEYVDGLLVGSMTEYVDGLLVGSVTAFAMTTPPQRWLECNGQAVSRTTYARLFARIGTKFNMTETSDADFNVPELRGEFLRGWDSGRGTDDTNRAFGSWQSDQMQSHVHPMIGVVKDTKGNFGEPIAWGGNWGLTWPGFQNTPTPLTEDPYDGKQIQHPPMYPPPPASHGEETRPRNVALLFCIKY